jgi:hypothetical protein
MGLDSPVSPDFRCPACGSARARFDFSTAQLSVVRCRDCGYRLASHGGDRIQQDYHEQYDQGAFLDSLAATRRRQSSVIIDLITRHLDRPDDLLDYGTGRGWFLDACRAAGMRRLAGTDTSKVAMDALAARGFEAVVVPPVEDAEWTSPLEQLSFRPRVVTLLDVIEHFPPQQLVSALEALVRILRPELVVIKVPSAGGLMYRTAGGLRRLGVTAPIEQLYQVGTFPPHRSYFTPRSLRSLLGRSGLRVRGRMGDVDFEPESLASRAASLQRLPHGITALGGRAAGFIATISHMTDAMIVIAAPEVRAGA